VVSLGGWAALRMQGGCPHIGLVIIVSKQEKLGVVGKIRLYWRRCTQVWVCTQRTVIIVSILQKKKKKETSLQVRLHCGGVVDVAAGGQCWPGQWRSALLVMLVWEWRCRVRTKFDSACGYSGGVGVGYTIGLGDVL